MAPIRNLCYPRLSNSSLGSLLHLLQSPRGFEKSGGIWINARVPSSPTLVKRQREWCWSDDVNRDLLDVTDPRFHIFSATTLPELLVFLPACQEFANLQATGQIYYAVEKHPKTFTNIDEATAAWEACREKVKSRVMLATADPESAQWFTLPNV
ncbi:hypothetical protein B0H14DRAFT_2625151 [Mycena olivaceomarginata]|nr:hypothetical protein B0H14DRAFT_2625151 [Mycena olivaceomarginata]